MAQGVGLVPIGSILAFAGDALDDPQNWKFCDGSALQQQQYQDLFRIIGTKWGGDGAGKFYLPKLNGVFLRAADAHQEIDKDGRTASRPDLHDQGNTAGVGSRQSGSVEKHNHTLHDPGHTHSYREPAGGGNSEAPGGQGLQGATTGSNTTGITLDTYGGSETRPVNVAVNYIIRVS